MNKNKDDTSLVTILVMVVVVIIFALLAMFDDSSSNYNGSSLDQLQQDRFKYERQQENTHQQMQLRENLNKIRSGYYD